ncbi:MAG: PP2C family protein-serine/threonine phosphatase [Candidatus Tectomicrobia bacterium]
MTTHIYTDEDSVIEQAYTALAELDPAARCRVLNAVSATFGLSAPGMPTPSQVSPRRQVDSRSLPEISSFAPTVSPGLFSGLDEEVAHTHALRCGKIGGGSHNRDAEVKTSGLQASLYAASCDGTRGGDLYYLSVCQYGQLTRMVLADVAGHGEAVSMISHVLYGVLTGYINAVAGHEVLTLVNQIVAEHPSLTMTTAVVVTYHRADRQLSFTYAGHPPILVKPPNQPAWRAAEPSRKETATPTAGLPLGVAPDTPYILDTMDVEVGSHLCLYTDGLTDARNAAEECFGVERLQSVLQLHAEAPLRRGKKAVLEAVQNHTEGTEPHDDITVLIAELN